MAVTLNTTHRRALPYVEGSIDPIDNGCNTKLLIICTSFVIVHGVSVESGGDELVIGRFRKQVPCELFDGKLVIRKVTVERLDDPIAVLPNGSSRVFFKSHRIGVSGQIQPPTGPFFSISSSCKKTVHIVFITDFSCCK